MVSTASFPHNKFVTFDQPAANGRQAESRPQTPPERPGFARFGMAAEALRIGLSQPRDELLPFPAPAPRPRVQLGDSFIDQLDLEGAMQRIGCFLDSQTPHQVMTVNLDFLSIARRNPVFRETLNQADLAVADGMPLVWL